eukprot:UN13738
MISTKFKGSFHNCMALMCGTSVKYHHDFTTLR